MTLKPDEREDYQSQDFEGFGNTAAWIEKACNGDRTAYHTLPLQEAIDDYEMIYGT